MTAPRPPAVVAVPTARLRPHPLAEAVPRMRPAEFAALLADVTAGGVLEPLRLAGDVQTVLDGRHRLEAARQLRLPSVPTLPSPCEPGGELAYMLRSAVLRRHLSDDQRAVLAVRLAAELGAGRRQASVRTAAQARWGRPASSGADASVPPGGPDASPHPSRAEATRALGVSRQRFETARALRATAPDLAARVEGGTLPLPMARKAAARRAALAELRARPQGELPADTMIWTGDAFELAARIPDGSVDLLLTDPPFDTAGLALWPAFGRLAVRVLRPGGWCVVYAGVMDMPSELAALADAGLVYWWVIAIGLQGPSPVIHLRGARSAWRPVLLFAKPPAPGVHAPLFRDHILHPAPAEKGFHPWQQSVGPARQLLRRFSLPGALVLDPFAGAGTFGVAAVLEGRRYLGIERDPDHAAVAHQRLAAALAERELVADAG